MFHKLISKRLLWWTFFSLLSLSAVAKQKTVQAPKSDKGDGKALLGIAHRVIELVDNTTPRWAYEVTFVLPDSAAFRSGLLAGDVVMSWDNHTLDTISTAQRRSALKDYLKTNKNVGDSLFIKVRRYTTEIHQDSKTLKEIEEKDWLRLLDHPKQDAKKQIEIQYKIDQFTKTVYLGRRAKVAELVPTQTILVQLLGEKTAFRNPIRAIAEELISTFNLTSDYHDLLSRYEEDEKWQQNFVNKRFQYVHRSPLDLLPIANHQTNEIVKIAEQGSLDLFELLSKQPIFSSRSTFSSVSTLSKGTIRSNRSLLRPPNTSELKDHILFIEHTLAKARRAREAAFERLNKQEIATLYQKLPPLMHRFSQSYYINQSEKQSSVKTDEENREVLRLMGKINVQSLFLSAKHLSNLTSSVWLKTLQRYEKQWLKDSHTSKGVLGKTVLNYNSTYGKIVIGSSDNNVYRRPATIIIDLGGNDQYYGANDPQKQPINALIDLSGNDQYSSALPYAQAATLLGVSLLFDFSGNDHYTGAYFSQAVAVGGVSILHDGSGDDHYWGQRYAQGVGFWGTGLLHDTDGSDKYYAWRYAQGVGGVSGIGLLLDKRGNDSYHALGESRSSYRTIGNFQSSSQGFGVGFRGYAPGGIGILIDQQGKDNYRAGNFAQGTGYFFALGILRDFGSQDDTYRASRYGMGASAHSAAGVLIEDGGNDRYDGNHIALLAGAWDLGLAAFWDKSGDDSYRQVARTFSVGVAAHNGHSVFLDSDGKDNYRIAIDQVQTGRNDYHGGNSFALFIDAGGDEDNYNSQKFSDNSLLYEYNHGFMLDLPVPLNEHTVKLYWQSIQQKSITP